ncbi:MAG: hypothetical protein KC502_23530 [Myxococcales bacterium]|nr:hypothetical protein [Myxococcales bacterium]
MDLAYLIAAAVGCTVLVAQVVLQLLGMGGGEELAGHEMSGDIDFHEGESNLFFGVLSFKTLSAFVAFFGLTGLACGQLGVESAALQLLISALAGLTAGAVVVVLMRLLVSLNSSGTSRLQDAIGRTARVHLSIPSGGTQQGKIVVDIGGREVELLAITNGPEIPTGAAVEVVSRTEGETFEVVRV